LALLLGAAAVMLALSCRADNQFYRDLSRVLTMESPRQGPQGVCLALLDFSSRIPPVTALPGRKAPGWVRLYYRIFPFKPDPRTVLRYGTDYRGPCGSRSRVLAALLEAQGIPARLTSLHDPHRRALHTVVEADCGSGWAVLDPTYNLSFPDEEGKLLSAEKLKEREDLFLRITTGKKGTAVPYHTFYPQERYTYQDVYPFNWEAVPGVFPAIRSLLSLFIQGEKLDRCIAWPDSYRRPKQFTAGILGAFSLVFLLFWLLRRTGRSSGVRNPDAEP